MKSSRALSQLTLVASDMAYGAPNFQFLTTLRQYDDTEPAFSPGYSYDQRFEVVHQDDDPASGFKYLILKNSANADLIVAFAGTDGINYLDWAANSFALGWSQWERNRFDVLGEISRRATPGAAIHFTGQSLGGALAEYAAYQWIQNAGLGANGVENQKNEKARTTLTTFNGLGSEQGLSDKLHGGGLIDQTLLGGLSQSAAYWIRNDLVTRLGGGHSGVPVYKLDHTSFNIKPEFLQARDSQYWDLGPVDAHRIEFGFYSRLSQSADFERYQVFTSGQFESLEIASAETQRMGRMAAAVFNGKFRNETEAAATLAAGLIGGALLGSASEISAFTREVLRSVRNAGFFAHENPTEMRVRDNVLDRVEQVNWGAVLQGLAALNSPISAGIYAGALMTALGAKHFDSGLVRNAFQAAANIAGVTAIDAPSALSKLFRGIIDWEIIAPSRNQSRAVLDGYGVTLAEMEPLISGGDESWLYDAESHLLTRGASVIRTRTADPIAQATEIENYGASVLAWLEGERKNLADLDPTYASVLRAQIEDFAQYDLAQALVNTGDVLNPVMLAHASVYGSSRVDFATYDRYRDALAIAVDDPRFANVKDILEAALARVEQGGERVVVKPRVAGQNVFDQPGFNAEDQVVAASVDEGQAKAFSLFLPYEADAGGQRILFSLAGSSPASYEVMSEGVTTRIQADGRFALIVPEGSRQLSFAIRSNADIDTDGTLTIAAQLADDIGQPTHRLHDEVSIAVDAVIEPTTNPANVVSGTTLDDNRNGDATHRPINGTAAADHIRALAGRDEASGQAGNDLIEGGVGADVLTGDSGADRVFADVAMDDAALRTYIATSGALIDNTDAPAVLSATTADWLVGELGDDTVVGSAAADILFGGGGSDLIVGGAGHDIIDGDDEYMPGAITGVTVERNWGGNPHEVWFSSISWNDAASAVGAADEIHGGAGDDVVRALYGADTVFGDNGDDTITGDEGDDSLFGGAGNDRISGGSHGADDVLRPSGDDYIDGGDGNDILHGESGADVLFGGTGDDVMHGFIGTIFAGGPNEDPTSDGVDHLSGGAGFDQLIGHGAADTLVGGDGNDQLFGDSDNTPVALHGDDTLDGGTGNDYLRGYGGDDELVGGQGEDTLQGEDGADYLDGGTDDDLLFGMAGDDNLLGGGDDDEIVGGAGNDRADGGLDDDAIWGEAGDDELHGGADNDYLDGGDGHDTIDGGSGGDRVYAMAGNDVVSGGADPDQLIGGAGADELAGNGDDDQLWGEADDDTITGDEGNDRLIGGEGNDRLDGGEGLDQVFGDAGDDTLSGGSGRDYLVGGAGNDVYLIDGDSAEDIIIDNEDQNTVRFGPDVSRNELRFRQGIDADGNDRYLVIEGGGTFSRVIIQSGMDAAVGRFEFADGASITHAQVMADLAAQNDPSKKPVGPPPTTATRYGTTANDTITGLSADDRISALGGDDVVSGGAGADRLEGGDGADRLDGGSGNDALSGGNGMDTYVFGRDRGRDTIEERFLSETGATELDTLELVAGVAPADVTLHRDGGDLVVAINQTAAQLRVGAHFLPTERLFNIVTGQMEDRPADHRIEQIRFANGTVWDAAAIVSRTLAGTQNTITGTAGNDVFTVDHANDVVTEAANAGDDRIQASVSYALVPNVERLTFTGFVDLNAWSTPGNPTSYLTGNAGHNVFNGPGTYFNAGGQLVWTVSGGVMGYAVMAGGAGDDTYHLRDTVGGQVIESIAQGYDTVVLNGVNWYTYQLPANVEALVSSEGGVGQLGSTRYRTGNALDNYIEGTTLGAPGPVLGNVIDGGAGADTMVGFGDNDRFIVDNAGDIAIDKGVFSNGTQESMEDEVHASISYELPDNLEILRLTGSAAIDGRGNDLANTLDGAANAAINKLAGGLGNDVYAAGANDLIEERPGEGIDTVEWSGTGTRVYTADDLPANIEGLAFGEDLGNADYVGDARMDRVTGNSGFNDLSGGAGDDTLKGGEGNDTLSGGTGDDQLDGGAGYDVLRFSRGFGHDMIYGDPSYEIAFDDTIAVSDLLFVDGELRIAGGDDRIEVGFAPSIRFADGTLLTATEVFAMLAASHSTTPTDAPDWLTGTPAADVIDALDGDDLVYGRDGADTLTGGDGDDRLFGEQGNDAVHGDAGNDRLEGGAGDDTLQAGTGNDTVLAGAGGDVVDGGAGADTLYGDDGDDRIVGGGGVDTLYGGAGDDRLSLGVDGGFLAGDAGNDQLSGNDGYDTLWGGSGDDRLDGGSGDDALIGDIGVDTYVLAFGGGFDYVQDPAIDGELTVIAVAAGLTPADIVLERTIDEYGSATLRITVAASADGLEMPEFGRPDRPVEVRFADGTVWTPAMVMDRLDRLEGTDLDDVLTGTTLDDLLFGLAGNDTLTGLAGDDLLDGGVGADSLEGGEGNDRYVVDDAGDVVSEVAFEGIDSVESTLSMTLASNVENLTLLGAAVSGIGNAESNSIIGNAAANLLDGKQGTDTLIGGTGNDTYVLDTVSDTIVENANEGTDTVTSSVSHTLGTHVEHLTLTGAGATNATGNAFANQLTGNAAANVLDGKAGADTLRGAAGNDTYVVDTLADVLIENASEGTDTVQSSVSFTLAANLENLTLTGAAALNGTGNAVANTLIGNAAANVLDGAAGIDSLRGGAGNDTYVVDAPADAVVENAGEGTDTVNASVSFTLGSNVENLTLTGSGVTNATGNTLANTLTGNAGANTLNGGIGNDTLRGGAGNDVYIVDAVGDLATENAGEGTDTVQSAVTWTLGANFEHLTLTGAAIVNATGNTLANTLTGNAAANVLDGAAGADALSGGAGNDTYVIDNALDTVTEAAAAGTDLVQSSVSSTLAANVENLTLTGTAVINGTGNALANTLQGNAAANALDGGAGADTLRGGAGSDVLTVDNATDVVIENVSEGDDTVRSYIAWTLGANVENLTLVGAAAVSANGNTLDNWLQGNGAANPLTGADGQDLIFGAAGNDSLNGGNGRDVLQGGDGNDTITDIAGNNVLHGALGVDVLAGGAGNELYLGGAGSDTMTLGTGADIIGFNRGDGQDIVNASAGADNTLSLGGGIKYTDVALRKAGNDLVVDVGATEQLTLKDWYLAAANRHVVNLQMVVDASADWNAASPNLLYNKRVAQFDFAGLVSQFDAARAANPALTQWGVASALASEHLGGSDTAALGGDLGYQYGHANTLAGIGWTPADSVLASAAFGLALQSLQSPATLFSGAKTLA